jgi:gluconate:H+ symporter, GntP family
MLLGLGMGMVVLVFLVLRTRIPAFLALIVAASITGLVGGLSGPAVVGSTTSGFGSALGTIGIVIGLGVMMGQVLEATGAADGWRSPSSGSRGRTGRTRPSPPQASSGWTWG